MRLPEWRFQRTGLACRGPNFRSARPIRHYDISSESSGRADRRGKRQARLERPAWSDWAILDARTRFLAQCAPCPSFRHLELVRRPPQGRYSGSRRRGCPGKEIVITREGGDLRPRRGGPNLREKQKGGATRGLPRRSPILVLLSPKHA